MWAVNSLIIAPEGVCCESQAMSPPHSGPQRKQRSFTFALGIYIDRHSDICFFGIQYTNSAMGPYRRTQYQRKYKKILHYERKDRIMNLLTI